MRGSTLQAGDNLLLSAGRDVNLTAALVDSSDGAVSVAVGRDVNLLSANETHDYSLDSYEKKKKTLSSTTTTRSGAGVSRSTITAPRDIADDKGRVIIAAGTRVNPLDTVSMRAPLVFLDGDDPAQLAWASARYGKTNAKLILVRGAPLALMKARQRRFYFDQGGTLVKHFGIRAVPAVVEQQGRVLRISEVPIKPRERKPS